LKIADVETPTLRATSAKEIPYSSTSLEVILYLALETASSFPL